jgi:signal transduction histidine kinase
MLLNVKNISKSFGPIAALVEISFDLAPGEILGVVGQRGSGKSTLFQLLSGVYLPTTGEIQIDDVTVQLKSPFHAQALGIETAHQTPSLAENLDGLQNIFLGREKSRLSQWGVLQNEEAMLNSARELFAEFNASPDLLFERAANLSSEQQQLVALARAMCRSSRLLLIDDALAALSFERQQTLLNFMRGLADKGVAIIISSDDLKHIFAVTHRILVLYQGRQIALRTTAETTPRDIVELIVGSNKQAKITPVIWALENYHTAQQQAEELRDTQETLRKNLMAQDTLNRQLFERLRNQVDALDQLTLALQEAHRRLMTERETERKALARDLHDQIIQDLLSYNYQLEEVESDSDGHQREELEKIRSGIRNVVGSLRMMCSDLRPPTIDSQGLSAAIRSFASQWSEQNDVALELEIDPALGRLPEAIELSVFRIVQEGLSNVRKHAHASNVKLMLKRSPAASLIVRLADNGRGLPSPLNLGDLLSRKHFGLVGISERVSLLSGTLQIVTAVNGGLELNIEIPSPYPSIGN